MAIKKGGNKMENEAYWNVELVKKGDLRVETMKKNSDPEAFKVIQEAKDEQLLVLSTSNSSPEKIKKALPYSQENLANIIKFNESKQAGI